MARYSFCCHGKCLCAWLYYSREQKVQMAVAVLPLFSLRTVGVTPHAPPDPTPLAALFGAALLHGRTFRHLQGAVISHSQPHRRPTSSTRARSLMQPVPGHYRSRAGPLSTVHKCHPVLETPDHLLKHHFPTSWAGRSLHQLQAMAGSAATPRAFISPFSCSSSCEGGFNSQTKC